MANTYGWVFIVMTCLLVGLGAGLVNGILIAYGRVVPFIATLAMLVAARGVAEIIAGRRNQVLNVPRFDAVFGGRLLGVDRVVWIFLFVVVIGWFVLTRTTFGRRTIAVGGNLEAARLAGIKVRRHTMYIYALSGLAAGIAGVILLAKSDTGVSTNGQLMELDSIAAVVIGGTLLIGGRGTVIGTFLGVLLFQSLLILFSSNNLDSSVQQVAKGAIIVAAVLLQNGFGARDRRSG
jgi:ribose transport system permease protein